MKFNKVNKIILFGGSFLLAELFQYLKKETDLETVVFSAARHLDEAVNEKNETLRQLLNREQVKYFEADDINSDKNLAAQVTPNTLGLAMGAAWTFQKPLVSIFNQNHFLDFMGVDLPKYDGGAHYTWMILHQQRQGGSNLQIINGGEETFHQGDLVKRQNFVLPAELVKPLDYFNFIVKKEIGFLQEFFQEIKQGKEFSIIPFDHLTATYFPFLNTRLNGLINWFWTGQEIALFISAFDDPYPGASTFLGDKKVILKDCQLLPPEESYHPFTSGLVIRKDALGLYVASVGNLILINKVLDENNQDVTASIQLGERFYTPAAELDKAMGFKAVYGAGGLINK
ncbi:MAG: hypothetical protein Q8P32_01570 [Candidatus Komeilibacteria bacterium]|nr:hypothetical protein [Candidatus Komeilibacteria bacterium]